MPDDPTHLIIGRMTPEQKLRVAERLYWDARELKAAALRALHPEWSEERISTEVRAAFLYHRD